MSLIQNKKDHRIQIRVLEAKNINKDEECDSYILVKVINDSSFGSGSVPTGSQTSLSVDKPNSLNRSMGRRHSKMTDIMFQAKTKVVARSKNPWFDDEFEVDLDENFKEINIEIWAKSLIVDRLLGTLTKSRYALESDSKIHEAWFVFSSADEAVSDKNGGSVRLKYSYTDEYMMPPSSYTKLIDCTFEDNYIVAQALGKATDEREEVAKTLVYISNSCNQAVDFLCTITSNEIKGTSDANTIFRHNSLGSKGIDQYMKLIGMKYLKQVLQPLIHEILIQNRPCELDPTRLEKTDNVEENFTVLEAYIKWAIDRILNSASNCPPQLRKIFSNLRIVALATFPNDPVVPYTVVTAFAFLRFFNAAILGIVLFDLILGPQLFGLSPDNEPPNPRNARTLTLISKTVQQLANMTAFDGKKEPYMAQLNHLVQSNVGKMKKYIDEITLPPSDSEIKDFVKKKEGGFKISRLFSFGKTDKKEKKEDELEKHIACLYRLFVRAAEKMKQNCSPNEKQQIDKLFKILEELAKIYDELNRELIAEKKAFAKKYEQEQRSSFVDSSKSNTSLSRSAETTRSFPQPSEISSNSLRDSKAM